MKVLLAVDGSRQSRWAEAWVRQGMGSGQRVEVLFVAPVNTHGEEVPSPLARAIGENGRRMTEVVADSLRDRHTAVGRVVESSHVAGAILERANKWKADLIVMGARGMSPLRSLFMGGVSNKVVRHAPCSVLVAHRAPVKNGRLLVGVDGSDSDEISRQAVAALKLVSTTPISLVHVMTDPLALWVPESGLPGGTGSTEDYRVARAALGQKAEKILRENKARWKKEFSLVSTHRREGFAADQLLLAVKAGRYGLAVVGRHGTSALERFLMGSVSQKLSAHAPCAVLVSHGRWRKKS